MHIRRKGGNAEKTPRSLSSKEDKRAGAKDKKMCTR
jgi:hypothetical protein